MSRLKILILGGHGFVGQRLKLAMASDPHEVVCRSRRDGLDLSDLKLAREQFAAIRPDVIFNCAAHVGSIHYVNQNAASVIHDNAQMALNLYSAALASCPAALIVNPLSNCSYPGDADVHFEPDWWKGEVHDSVLSYGNAKRFIHVLSKCHLRQHGLKSFNFLVPNAFGPGDYTDPNRTHALNGMIIRMLQAQSRGDATFEIWGTGSPVREWGYVDDIAAILRAACDPGLKLEPVIPVNIAQNKGFSIRESAERIAEAVGFRGALCFNATYQDGAPRKVLDDRRFRGLFPDFRFTDHSEAIRRTVEYYKSVLKLEAS